jgi:S1-C subfamily serine protease
MLKYRRMNTSNTGKSIFYFFLLAFLNAGNPVLAGDFKSFADDRNKAKQLLREGNYISGLNKLAGLARRGDAVAANDLGVIYLKSKVKAIPRDPDLSERYFKVAAELCYEPSIKLLKQLFYNRKGSGFFDPLKSERLAKSCNAQVDEKKSPVIGLALGPKPKGKVETNNFDQINDIVRKKWSESLPIYDSAKSGGSSVALNGDGLFLTNHHVIDECEGIAVLYNDMKAKGRVTAYDSALDVALVDVSAPSPFYAKLDNSKPLIGEELIALGFPMGVAFGDGPSYSKGELTNANDSETSIEGHRFKREGFLLTSVPIASGNSGGPVFNQTGALRGIVSYVINSSAVEEFLTKDDKGPTVSATTLSFIVSSTRIVNWLTTKGANHKLITGNKQLKPSHVITAEGTKALAKIECY